MVEIVVESRLQPRRRSLRSARLRGSRVDRRRTSRVAVLATIAALVGLLGVPPVSAQEERPAGFDQSAPVGLTLEAERQTITSALRVDLTFEYATLPLHRGSVGGETVWFVVTDVSDAGVARQMGINHAPKLANVPRMCPACSQEVATSDPLLGRAPVEFQGAPDFSPSRSLRRGPAGAPFPVQSSAPGAVGRADYSPFVTVGSSPIVYNAPIVATGDGPFDVTTHRNTHDRTLGIDTVHMTTDHLYVRGFSNGKPILYLSFESSDAFTAMIERSTFVPALADLTFPNGGGRTDSARASIFTFVNARVGLEPPSPRGASDGPGRNQGLTHALSFAIAERDAAIANRDVIEGLRNGGDVSNIFDIFPTNTSAGDRNEYSPAWDLQVGVYSDAAVAAGLNGLKTDANEVRRLAAQGLVTALGGRPHTAAGGSPAASINVLINCPALAFLEEPPLGPRIPAAGQPPPPPPQPAPSTDYLTAFQANSNSLWTAGTSGARDLRLGVMPGTSPSITRLTTGGHQTAFQANTGHLWVTGPAGTRDTGLGMRAGTSPDITALPNGNYQVAFQANTGSLWVAGAAGTRDLKLGMRDATSPSITTLANGSYGVAFQSNGGSLWVAGGTGTRNLGLGMAPGSSPDIAALTRGGFQAALQANTGTLWTAGTAGTRNLQLGMASGTSPSITALRDNGYQMAFQANTGNVYVSGTAGTRDLRLGMRANTSPSITALNTGGYQLAFQANTGSLYVTGSAGTRDLSLGMARDTSPSIG